MATWKKLVVSGSNISQLNNDAQYISASQVPAAANAFSTASINGVELLADSNQGNFNIVTGSAGTGLTIEGTAGTDTISFDLSAIPNSTLENSAITIAGTSTSLGGSITADTIAGQISDDTITNAQLANESITFGTDEVSLGDTVTQLDVTGITGSFTGSLADGTTAVTQTQGDNSTKVATTAYVDAVATAADLDLSGDGGTTTSVDLDSQTLAFSGADGIEASASAQALTVGIADGGIANAKLANDSITIAGTSTALGESITADTIAGQISDDTITNAQLANEGITIGNETVNLGGTLTTISGLEGSGSFSGSFEGDGSGLTGLATTLTVDGDTGTQDVDLIDDDLQILGTANEIETAVTVDGTDVKVTIGLPDDVIIGNDLTVNGDLVVEGTSSFRHEDTLEVADQFILLNSGSNANSDGGIVIQQDTQDIGDVFGFENQGGTPSRWGVASDFHASASTFTPDGYVSIALEGAADTDSAIQAAVPDSRYNAKGNIWIADSENIWIYS